MAYGHEVMFILDRSDVRNYAICYIAEHGADDETRELISGGYEDDPNEWDAVACGLMNSLIEDDLRQVHLDLVKAFFDETATLSVEHGLAHISAVTGSGRLEFRAFSVEPAGDEDEPQTLGISLLSRYRPTWLDWRDEHGGSAGPVILTDEMTALIASARKALVPVVPEIADAPVGVVLCHY